MAVKANIDQKRIDETLSAYRELQLRFDRMRDRLRLTEDNRSTVNRRIYEKVRAEYDRELDSIRSQMSPLRSELESLRTHLEESARDVRARLTTVEEELAEASFRHAVGEFDSSEIDKRKREIEARLADARAALELVHKNAAALDAVQSAVTAVAPPEEFADEPVAVAAPAPEAPRRPTLRASDLAAPAAHTNSQPKAAAAVAARPYSEPVEEPAPSQAAPRAAAAPERTTPPAAGSEDPFINPHDWIDEVGNDPLHKLREVPTSAAGHAPRNATGPATATNAAPQRGPAPSLVFVNGANAGQSIPLLPTTLTIGREHDNNVEIKDGDVARYHARILHERGSYVVEDLESTTGTWVNGNRARRAVLHHGDTIRVGQTELAIDFEWAARKR